MEPRAPHAYQDFIQRYPRLAKAWEMSAQAGQEGPLDAKTQRFIKLAIAIGALREGAIRANVRKALAMGISKAEIEQVIALATGTVGFPGTVAVFTWINDIFERTEQEASS
jgi:alkylhydroperoxidase/carboxymuconolactone decarboxylase family protein YurZ